MSRFFVVAVLWAGFCSAVAFAQSAKALTCEAFTGHFIQLTTKSGKSFEVYRTGPAASRTGILLLPGRLGIDTPLLKWADRLGTRGYRVVVVDTKKAGSHDSTGTPPTLVAPHKLLAREVAAIRFLAAPGRSVVTMGWGSYGARQAFKASAAAPDQVSGIVLGDGGLSVSDATIGKTRAIVLLIAFRSSMKAANVHKFEARMRRLRRPLFVQSYAVDPTTVDPNDVGDPDYNGVVAKKMWRRAGEFLMRVNRLCRRCAPYPHYLFDYHD